MPPSNHLACTMTSDQHSSPLASSGLHTILGANGVIARELATALAGAGLSVRQVSRHPRAVNPADQLRAADLLDAKSVSSAVAGSEVVYLVAGLTYDTATWQTQWPVVMRHAMEACALHGARLVFFDNVYAYGAVQGAMTEETPFNPCSRKGEVRAAVATRLLDAMQRGQIKALIARSADFYGPGAANSFLNLTVFGRLRSGKSPQWIGDPASVHQFTHTPDAGRALALLGQTESAFGQTWHLPTAQDPVTGEDMVRLACAAAGRPYRLQVMPEWLLGPLGWFVKPLRENREMMYQLNRDYRFASGKIEQALGLTPTPYPAGVGATWAASR